MAERARVSQRLIALGLLPADAPPSEFEGYEGELVATTILAASGRAWWFDAGTARGRGAPHGLLRHGRRSGGGEASCDPAGDASGTEAFRCPMGAAGGAVAGAFAAAWRPGTRRDADDAERRRYTPSMESQDGRRARAEARRQKAILRRGTLQADEPDLSPVSGPLALTLVTRLTLESWSLSGRAVPTYGRDTVPYRFVPGRET